MEPGKIRMIDVTGKAESERRAVAVGRVHMQPATLELIRKGELQKGDVLAAAQTAGILAAKDTHRLIPLCHPLQLTELAIGFKLVQDGSSFIGVEITASAKGMGKTGFEMEALVAVAISALTIYDMCKAVDKGMTIGDVRLLSKSGGKSGPYVAEV
jgi:cyclic pyranopterin monophosphate synthase